MKEFSTKNILLISLVSAMLILLAFDLLPSLFYHNIDKDVFVTIHTVLGFFSTMLALYIFTMGWYSYINSKNTYALFLGCAFFAVGVIDLMHTLSFPGMPDFVTANSTNKEVLFYTTARLLLASSLLISVFIRPDTKLRLISNYMIYIIFAALSFIVFVLVVGYEPSLPTLFSEGTAFTDVKIYSGSLIIVLLSFSFILYYRRSSKANETFMKLLLSAIVFLIFSEITFTFYDPSHNTYGILALAFKIMGFFLIYEIYADLLLSFEEDKDSLSLKMDAIRYKQTKAALKETEKRYEMIFENVNDMIIYVSRFGTILNVNQKVESIFGYKPDEVIGKNFMKLGALNLVNLQNIVKQFKEAAQRGDVEDTTGKGTNLIELEIEKSDGKKAFIEVSTTPVKRYGKLEGFLSIIRDISDRKEASMALKESEERYRLISDNMADEIWLMDMDMNILFISPSVSKRRGFSLEDMQKMSWAGLLTPESLDTAVDALEEKLTLENFTQKDLLVSKTMDLEFYTKDGSTVWSAVTISLIRDEKGKPHGLLGVAHDVTDRKRIETEREKLNLALQAKNKELEQIVYVASHDLRSPLVNVQGFGNEISHSVKEMISLIKEEDMPEDVKESLNQIIKTDILESLGYITTSVSKMDTLLTGLLKVSRLGRASVDIEELDMNKQVSDITETFEFMIKENEVELDIEDLPPCRGDSVQINQLFSNLIDNSLKYLSPDRPGVITVSGYEEDRYSVYCVEDNGMGIHQEHQKKVFEIFHRLTPDMGTGDGLGLTIVNMIVERHRGKIWIESEFGKGTKMYVKLPRKEVV